MVLLFSVITAISSTVGFFEVFPKYINEIDEKMPYFEIKSGSFYSQEEFGFDFNKSVYVYHSQEAPISGDSIDNLYKETNKKYDTYLVINQKDVDVYRKNTSNSLYKFGKLIFSEFNDTNKTEIVSYVKEFSDSLWSKATILIAFVVTTFIVYGIYRLWLLILYSFSVFFINVIFMNKLRGRDYFKVAIYVSTLPVLLEMVAFVVAKGLPDSASFITMLISIIYTYSALKAIKLDSIMLSAIGNTPEEKIRNAINQAQQELEKQLEELEEREAEKKRREEMAEKEIQEESKEEAPKENNEESKDNIEDPDNKEDK